MPLQKPLDPLDAEFQRLVDEANADALSDFSGAADQDFAALQKLAIEDEARLRIAPTPDELSVVKPVVNLSGSKLPHPVTAFQQEFTPLERETMLAAPPYQTPKPRVPVQPTAPQPEPLTSDNFLDRAVEAQTRLSQHRLSLGEADARGTAGAAAGMTRASAQGMELLGRAINDEQTRLIGTWVDDKMKKAGEYWAPREQMAGDILMNPELLLKEQWWHYNLSSGATSALAFLVPALAANRIVGGVGQAAMWTDRTRKIVQAVGGPAAGVTVESFVQAALDRADAIDRGVPEAEADAIAAKSFGMNMAGGAAFSGAGFAVPNVLNANLATKLLAGFFSQGAEEGYQRGISNYLADENLLEGVVTESLIGGIVGAPMGAVMDVGEVPGTAPELPGSPPPNAGDFLVRDRAAEQEADLIRQELTGLGFTPEQIADLVPAERAGLVEQVDQGQRDLRQRSVDEWLATNARNRDRFGSYEYFDAATQAEVRQQEADDAATQRVNSRLQLETIRQLQQAGIAHEVIGSIEAEEEAAFVLDQARKKPKVPVRARQEFTQTPGLAGYLGADKKAQQAAQQEQADMDATRQLLEELEAETGGAVVAPKPEGAQTSVAGRDVSEDQGDSGEGAGAGAVGDAAGRGIPASSPIGREGAKQREARRVAHYESVYTHALEASRQLDPDLDEAEFKREFDERVSLAEEAAKARYDYGHEPGDALREIAKRGGISVAAEEGGGYTGGLRDGGAAPNGELAGIRGVFRARTRDAVTGRSNTGHSLDDMVRILQGEPRFNWIQDIPDLVDLLEDAVRRGDVSQNYLDVFPGTKELRQAGVKNEEIWWTGPSVENPGISTLDPQTDKALDDALGALDELLGGGDESIDEPGALGMAIGPSIDPKVVAGAIQVFRALGTAGVTDFEKAVRVLSQKKGREWVEGLSAVLPKAWELVRKGNAKMGPAGDVGAILASEKAHGREEPRGGEGAPGAGAQSAAGSSGHVDVGRGSGAGPAVDPVKHEPAPGDSGAGVVERDGGGISEDVPEVSPRRASIDEQREAVRGSQHVAGYPRRSELRGAEHPKVIVETRALAGVPYPKLTTEFTSTHALDAVKAGRVSVQQAEQALAAVQANLGERGEALGEHYIDAFDQPVPKGYRWALSSIGGSDRMWNIRVERQSDGELLYKEITQAATQKEAARIGAAKAWELAGRESGARPGHGYLIADAVGVGKSREQALTILELMHRAKEEGRDLRLIFTTLRHSNIADFLNELAYVASGRTLEGLDLASQDEYSLDERKPGTIPFDVVKMADHKAGREHKLPKKKHAIYIVDHQQNLPRYIDQLLEAEPHGLVADEAHRLKNQGTQKWNAWLRMHAWIYSKVPREQQTFVYATATPAQDPENYEYLYGLRLWPIDGFGEWVNVITGTADEITARKLLRYAETGAENAQALQAVLDGRSVTGPSAAVMISQAEAEQIPREMKALGRMSARDLWREGTEFRVHPGTLTAGEQHRYQLFTKISGDIIALLRKHKLGGNAVMHINGQLTLAAQRMQVDARLRRGIEVAKGYVESGHQVVFSVMHVNETDPAIGGNLHAAIRMIPDTKKINGIDVPLPEVMEAKERLFEEAAKLGKFAAPAQVLKDAFGESQVAELVGAMTKDQIQSVRDFQAGKRGVILISAAGSTGVNLQQRFLVEDRQGAQGRRVFVPVQHEWNAMNEIQRYGRVDRADSVTPPIIAVVSFGTPIERRFFATIVSRLKSMGALSSGGGSALIDAMDDLDLTDATTDTAMRAAWRQAPEELRALFPDSENFKAESGAPLAELPRAVTMQDVQDGLVLLPLGRQDQFWNLLLKERARLIKERNEQQGDDAKTQHSRGRVLRTFEIGDKLTLYQVIDENGKRFGILQGVVMPHMPRIRPAIAGSDGRARRRYLSFEQKHNRELISGLEIVWNRIPSVAAAFGKQIGPWNYRLRADVFNALDAGEHITLEQKNEKGNHLVLRKGDAGYVIDYATLKMRDRLGEAGAEFNAKNNTWTLAGQAELSRFLYEFRPKGTSSQFGWKSSEDPSYFGRTTGGGAKRKPSISSLFRKPHPRDRENDPTLNYPKPTGVPIATKPMDQWGPRQMREFLEEQLSVPLRTRGMGRMKAWGVYFLRSRGARIQNFPEMIRTLVAEDMPVILHEVGHHIHERILGIDPKDPRWKMELLKVGATTTLPSYGLRQRLAEGQAEFTRLWMLDPSEAFNQAPNYAAAFEAKLAEREMKQLGKTLRTVQQQLAGFRELDKEARVSARISFGDPTPTNDTRSGYEKFEHEVLDDLARLDRVTTGASLDITEDAYRLSRLARGWTDKARTFLKHGIRSNDGKFIYGRGLRAILKPVKGQEVEFATYLVARRALELHGRADVREWAIPKGEAQAIVARASAEFIAVAEQIYAFQDALLEYAIENEAITRKQADLMRELNQRYVPFQRVLDAWAHSSGSSVSDKFADRSSGFHRIHGSGYDIINPFESIVKNTFVLVNMIEHNNAMRALTDFADSHAATAKWAFHMPPERVATTFALGKIEKDIVGALASMGVSIPALSQSAAAQLVTVFTPAAFANGKHRMVTVIKKGRREFYEINDKPLFDLLVAMGPQATLPVIRWLFVKPASVLRASVTRTLGFITRNALRDPWVAFIQSRHGFVPIVDHVYGLYHVARRTDLFQVAMTSGMGQSALTSMSREGMQDELRGVSGGGTIDLWRRVTGEFDGAHARTRRTRDVAFDVIKSPFQLLGAVSEAIELAPRIGEFRLALIAEGQRQNVTQRVLGNLKGARTNTKEALKQATESTLKTGALAGRDLTLDFQRGGRTVRAANMAVPFLNPRVQGWDRMARTLSPKNLKADPETALRLAALPALALFLWWLNHDDEDYRKIEQWEKDAYWHIKAPWSTSGFIRIPKPFEYASLFGNTIEATLDHINGEDPEAAHRLMRQLVSSRDLSTEGFINGLVLSMVPVLVLPFIENAANFKFFFERPISPPMQGNRDHQWLDYNRWTSHTARRLGRVMNYSPNKLENLVYSYTGNMGKGFAQSADTVLDKVGLAPNLPSRGVAGWPGIGALYTEPGRTNTSRAQRRLYDVEDKLRGTESDLRDLSGLANTQLQARGFEDRVEPAMPLDALRRLAERADGIDELDAMVWSREKRGDMLSNRTLIRQGVNALRDQRAFIDAVLENDKLSSDEKRKRLDEIADRMDRIARIALGEADNKPTTGALPVTPKR